MISKYVNATAISEIGSSVSNLLRIPLAISCVDGTILYVSDSWGNKELLLNEYLNCLIKSAGSDRYPVSGEACMVVPININNVVMGYGIVEVKEDEAKENDIKEFISRLKKILNTCFTSALHKTQGYLSLTKSEAKDISRRFQMGSSTREETYANLLDNILNFSSVDLAVIAVIDERTGLFRADTISGEKNLMPDFHCLEKGLLGRWTLHEKQPVIVTHPEEDPRCIGLTNSDVKTIAAWPLFIRDRSYGALYVISRSDTGFESWVNESIDFLSMHLSFMLDSENRENKNSEHTRRLKALMEISRILNSSKDTGTLLNLLTDLTVNLFDFDTCCVYLREKPGAKIKLMAARGVTPDEVFLLERRFDLREAVDMEREPQFFDIPILINDIEMGFISLPGFREGTLCPEDRELLRAFACMAGIAVNHSLMAGETKQTLLETVAVLCLAIEARDKMMLGHSEKVRDLGVALAKAVGLTAKEVEMIESACLLHDIGKLGIPESLLNKPGSLSIREYEEFKKHPVIGAEILSAVTSLEAVTTIVRHHHERYNGGGYPDDLRGDKIPVGARILAIADTFSSLVSKRSYRSAKDPFEALEILRANAGTHFDPYLVGVFEKIVRQRYSFGLEINQHEEASIKSQPGLEGGEVGLTEREVEILAHIAAGMSNREIAAALYLSEKTVKTHVTHILKKLNLPDRTKAAIYAIQKELVKHVKVSIRP